MTSAQEAEVQRVLRSQSTDWATMRDMTKTWPVKFFDYAESRMHADISNKMLEPQIRAILHKLRDERVAQDNHEAVLEKIGAGSVAHIGQNHGIAGSHVTVIEPHFHSASPIPEPTPKKKSWLRRWWTVIAGLLTLTATVIKIVEYFGVRPTTKIEDNSSNALPNVTLDPRINFSVKPVPRNPGMPSIGGIKWQKQYTGLTIEISCADAAINALDFTIELDRRKAATIIQGVGKITGFGDVTSYPAKPGIPLAVKGRTKSGEEFTWMSDLMDPQERQWRVRCERIPKGGFLRLVVATVRYAGPPLSDDDPDPIKRIEIVGEVEMKLDNGTVRTEKIGLDYPLPTPQRPERQLIN